MSASYRGENIKTFKVWYTGKTINGTNASRTAVALTAGTAGVLATGQLPVGAVLVRDPFAFDTGGNKLGIGTDASPTTVRTGAYEGLDYTQPQTSYLNQRKVVVVEPGVAPPNDSTGGRWVTVIESADTCEVLTVGTGTATITAGHQLTVINASFAATIAAANPPTTVAELVEVINNGIGIALEANTATVGRRAAKLCGVQNPAIS